MDIRNSIGQITKFFQSQKSYSQDGEDVVLDSFYEKAGKYKGFFVDVGAHHPVRFSNTWLFYQKGWRGINIDPTPGSMRLFNIFRRGDINLEIGVGKVESIMKFYCFNETALNTFNDKIAMERDNGKRYRIIKEIPVKIIPLSNILLNYVPKGVKIDFLTVDVEGMDLEVLMSNDWTLFRPEYIIVEDLSFRINKIDESVIYKYLTLLNYALVSSLKRSLIFHSLI